MAERALRSIGFQTLTVSTTPLSLTVPLGATGAYLTCETNDIRYRVDGVDPTATVGHILVNHTAPVIIQGRSLLLGMRMLRLGAGDSVLSCSYFSNY
jgi:hypothetical protein